MVMGVQCIAAYDFERKNKVGSNASIFMYKFTVIPYFVILDSILYLNKCTALYLG